MKIYDLPCFDSRRSFYGKAHVIEKDNGEKVLQSYNTEVCRVTPSGEFVRMWAGYDPRRKLPGYDGPRIAG